MKMQYGFAFDDNGHFLGERDDKGRKVTAVLYGNPSIYEFSLVPVGADPGAERASDLYKIMSDNGLSIGALERAAKFQNLHFGKLCQTLGIDPNRTPQPKPSRVDALHADLMARKKHGKFHLLQR